MNRIKSLSVLVVLTVFVALPSLSSLSLPQNVSHHLSSVLPSSDESLPLPDESLPWHDESLLLSGGLSVMTVPDTAAVAEDTLAAGGKKKKKNWKRVKEEILLSVPGVNVGYAVYVGTKAIRDARKTLNARMQHIRDSLNAVGGANVELLDDSVARRAVRSDSIAVAGTGFSADTSAIVRPVVVAPRDTAVAATDGEVTKPAFRLNPAGCRKTSSADIAHCDGSGVCAACAGAKRHYTMSQGVWRFVDCTNCGGTGKCPGCKGED